MKKAIASIVLVSSAIFMAGCAGTQNQEPQQVPVQEQPISQLQKMADIKQAYISEGIIAGLGVGESMDEQIAVEKAELNARNDIAQVLNSHITAVAKITSETIGEGSAQEYEGIFRTDVKVDLIGTYVNKQVVTTTPEGKTKVYTIVSFKHNVIDEYITIITDKKSLPPAKAQSIREKAAKAYSELNF